MAEGVKEGLEKHQKTLGTKHHSAKDVQKDLDSARAKQQDYQAVRAESVRVVNPALQAADSAARTYIKCSRKALGDHLGEQWSVEYAEAGYVNNTLRIPFSVAERETLVKALASYFETHPEYEVPARGVTAQNGDAVHKTLVDARQAARDMVTKQKTSKSARDQAVATLRQRLIGVLKELRLVLTSDSPTWRAFGLNVPADRLSPAAKERAAAKAKEKADAKAKAKAEKEELKALEDQLKALGKARRRGTPLTPAAKGDSDVALAV